MTEKFDVMDTIDPGFARSFERPTLPWWKWQAQLKALFPVAEEFELARAIYSFQTAYEDGLTPQQAYDDFDAWTQE